MNNKTQKILKRIVLDPFNMHPENRRQKFSERKDINGFSRIVHVKDPNYLRPVNKYVAQNVTPNKIEKRKRRKFPNV